MTLRSLAIAERFRSAFADLAELEKTAPGDVDALVSGIVQHLRAWRPESVAPLSDLAEPTEPIRDPRKRAA